MSSSHEKARPRFITALIETFGFSPWLATMVALFLIFVAAAALVWLWLSAPPRVITLSSGPPGSTFQLYAEDYQRFLAKKGVTLKILPSGGSLDNLKRLQDPASGVDVGFVQGGLVSEPPPPELVSLGSVAYQPMLVFYRGSAHIARLSELAGKRIGIGAIGSGSHALAKVLLEANGITGAPTTLVETAAEGQGKDLVDKKIDAVFLMGDSAPLTTIQSLLRNPEIQLYQFTQADAYVRRRGLSYLNKIVFPRGAIDLATDLPSQDVVLVGPALELVATKKLNSAISDVLLSAARKRHSPAGLMARRDEFPAPLEQVIPISDDAKRYYKSGEGFTYRLVDSFWLASLINRLLVAIVPLILVGVPTIRLLPVMYRWSVQLRIFRCYRPLLRLERDAQEKLPPGRAQELMERLEEIEHEVNKLKVPASFANQFYALQEHVAFVRARIAAATGRARQGG